jgi:GT2 family glycosyltransferase
MEIKDTSQQVPISFVVIAYNEAANIARTLAAITELEGLSEHEILVVDDGSCDGTAQIVADIAARNPCVRLIALADNHGRGYARRMGVAKALGSLIALVDADILLPADWLMRARAALRDHDAVGGIAVPDGDVAYIYKRFGLVPRIVHGTTAVTGNNGLYRRQVFEVVNFDPALREGEDSALNYAMRCHGLSLATVPGLLVHHEENKTLRTSLKWLFDIGRGATRQLLTYRQVRQPDVVTGAFLSTVTLGVFLARREHPLIGVAVPSGFVLAASVQHVRTRFEIPRSYWPRMAPAVFVDSALLMAYFAGRLVGLAAPRQRSAPVRAASRTQDSRVAPTQEEDGSGVTEACPIS